MLLDRHLKRVERHFYWRKIIQDHVTDIKAERVAKKGFTGGNGHTHVSDPTASTALKNIALIVSIKLDLGMYTATVFHPEDWLDVVNRTYELYQTQIAGRVMMCRFEKQQKCEVTCGLIGISKQSYYDWRKEFLTDAAVMALNKKILEI